MARPEHEALARVFASTSLLGPPYGDKLLRLIEHLFSAEEAAVAVHLPYYRPAPAERIARRPKLSVESVLPLLEEMARRRVIFKNEKGYGLLPLIPGMFEYMLQTGADTPWHREYARLLLDLYATGFPHSFGHRSAPAIRNIPVGAALDERSRPLARDDVEEMIERNEPLGVLNVCQCRQSMRFVGKECKRATPEDGCLVFGSRFARSIEEKGNGRRVSREEMRAIVAERVGKKLVFMTGNVGAGSPNAICTCCDCCCHGLEIFNEYGSAWLVAAPRFVARVDEDVCTRCGKCAAVCNTHAHSMKDKKHRFDPGRCIGCGLCVIACKEGAISLELNPRWQPPSSDFKSLAFRLLPGSIYSWLRTTIERRFGGSQ